MTEIESQLEAAQGELREYSGKLLEKIKRSWFGAPSQEAIAHMKELAFRSLYLEGKASAEKRAADEAAEQAWRRRMEEKIDQIGSEKPCEGCISGKLN
jgi:hypothetical protein